MRQKVRFERRVEFTFIINSTRSGVIYRLFLRVGLNLNSLSLSLRLSPLRRWSPRSPLADLPLLVSLDAAENPICVSL